MRDDEAFLRAIIDNPDDDLPRLVYADYLDEHGDPERAEFIRLQCDFARSPLADEPRRKKLWDRQWDLLTQHRERWAGSLGAISHELIYRRGFVEAVSLSAGAFLRHAESLWQVAPIRDLRLLDAWEEMDRLAASPHLGHIRGLSLANDQLESADVRRLTRSPHFAGLERLDLRDNRFGSDAVDAIADSAQLVRLRILVLSENDVRTGGAAALAGTKHRDRLEELALADTNIGPGGVEALATGPGLPSLRVLDLSLNRIDNRGVRALLNGPSAQRWHRILLRHAGLTPDQREDLERHFGPGRVVFE